MSPSSPRVFTVLGFATTHAALDAEQLLADLGVSVTPIPAPAELGGALCGIALRIEPSDTERALTLLDHAERAPVVVGEICDI